MMWERGLAGYYCNFGKWSRALPSRLGHTDTVLYVLVCLPVGLSESSPAKAVSYRLFVFELSVNMHVSISSKNTNRQRWPQ